ncbi:AMP-binding protein [uncultured Microbulbifer sp.]|uniref:AMP-binding protein n=1 Tax=uncultured Microbulbifer sp. TaxID=348147 RepID=UPI00261AA3F8|nr:AMP-binding protein [uncultured Microbulbifer sp.]
MGIKKHKSQHISAYIDQSIKEAEKNQIFNKTVLSNLSQADQEKFEAYAKGPDVKIPYQMIHQAIEYQTIKQGGAIAAKHRNLQITYGELSRQASYLAVQLNKLGVGPGDNVGLFLERSIYMLVGILAILKTGAAYVPQDVRITPKSILLKVMGVAGIRVYLTLSHLIEKIPSSVNHTILAIDDLHRSSGSWKSNISTKMCVTKVNPNNNCFILFTSGTTGTPNGVQVTHGNVCNILLSRPGNLGIKSGYKVSQLLNIAFDMAAWEILGCLAHGGTLMIRDTDFTEVARQCDVIIATPSILSKIDSTLCHSTKTVAVAGEPCPKPLAEQWAAKCQFINSYGPTETTIINTAQLYFSYPYSLTIGKPTPNNTVYLLDEHLRPCSIGSIGEIWVGGKGVTAGYINNIELTRERYQPDPFIANGGMMFRTRDLGRWNENGDLEHWGRTDDQVKIKGFRVELDSISTVTESVKGCQQAVTLKISNEKLVTFVTPLSVDTQNCMDTIGARLPYYCLPSTIIALSEFPVTDRGKIDKQALMDQVHKKTVHYSS